MDPKTLTLPHSLLRQKVSDPVLHWTFFLLVCLVVVSSASNIF